MTDEEDKAIRQKRTDAFLAGMVEAHKQSNQPRVMTEEDEKSIEQQRTIATLGAIAEAHNKRVTVRKEREKSTVQLFLILGSIWAVCAYFLPNWLSAILFIGIFVVIGLIVGGDDEPEQPTRFAGED